MSLPAEIWTRIFDLAADDDTLCLPGILTSLEESVWYQDDWEFYLVSGDPVSKWNLRSPEQAMHLLLGRSYDTKKAIISTCRHWQQLGFESLFRCLYSNHAMKEVVAFSAMLDSTSASSATSYGRSTKRIHIGPDSASPIEECQGNITAIIRHCPNLEVFVIERPLGSSSSPIIHALAHHASGNLHTLHLNIPGGSVSTIIWALNALPRIAAVHIDFGSSAGEEITHPRSTADLQAKLPHLCQISLRGFVGTLLEQLKERELPSLRIFSIDDRSSIHGRQDIVEFFKCHGSSLLLLDLNLKKFDSVPLILDLCPKLQTFAFNADWRITPPGEVASKIINWPHQHIATILLHGLYYAFGVGARYSLAAANNPFEVHYTTLSNDLNMTALNKDNFPKLNRIRLGNKSILEDLNETNGPSREHGGYDRWLKWCMMCTDAGIKLEDCTGQPLGTLPGGNSEDEESGDEEVEGGEEDVNSEEG